MGNRGGHNRITCAIGERFGRWTVIGEPQAISKQTMQLCRCNCGTERMVMTRTLRNQRSFSCGCFKDETTRQRSTTHGESKTRLYRIWFAMKRRCQDANQPCYHHYGGRGIRVCEEWNKGYPAFRVWALANGYRDDLTIDRIDCNGHYEPSNCRWITPKEQGFNRRNNHRVSAFGETKTLTEWTQDPRCAVISPNSIRNRIRAGWNSEAAIQTRSNVRNRHSKH